MSRPYVPHCRKCDFFKIYESFNDFSYSRCQGFKCLKLNRFVSYQEAKTSPKWCPRRLNYFKYSGGY